MKLLRMKDRSEEKQLPEDAEDRIKVSRASSNAAIVRTHHATTTMNVHSLHTTTLK